MWAHGFVHSALASTLLMATMLSACTSWRVQPVPPEQLLNEEHPDAVRIRRADRGLVVVTSPEVIPDSLVGTIGDHRIGVPLTDITEIAVRRGNALKTIGLVLGLAVIVPVIIFVASCPDTGCTGS